MPAAPTGLNCTSVRVYLMELRDQLGIDQAADLVAVARERGLLPAPPPEQEAGLDLA